MPFNPEICAMSSMGGREFIRDLSVGPSHLENSVLRLDPFSNIDVPCGESAERQGRGVTAQPAEAWLNAGKRALAEREKFNPIFMRIVEQRTDLKSFQVAAQERRKG